MARFIRDTHMAQSIRLTFWASVKVSTMKFVADRTDMCTEHSYSLSRGVEHQGN